MEGFESKRQVYRDFIFEINVLVSDHDDLKLEMEICNRRIVELHEEREDIIEELKEYKTCPLCGSNLKEDCLNG